MNYPRKYKRGNQGTIFCDLMIFGKNEEKLVRTYSFYFHTYGSGCYMTVAFVIANYGKRVQ